MAGPLPEALATVRAAVLDDARLVRAVAAGRRRGQEPRWRRAELRPVDLKAGRHLQLTAYDTTQAFTSNHPAGEEAARVVDDLLAQPFGNWHVDTTEETLQVRVTKKGEAMLHRAPVTGPRQVDVAHDRVKERVLSPDDSVLVATGISDAHGRVKPTRERKYRQVEELVRDLMPVVQDALRAGHQRRPTEADPLRVVDLGCGNGYLTFAVHAALTAAGLPVRVTGVDSKAQAREHNLAVAARLGVTASTDFLVGTIGDVVLDPPPEVVLALHACDTATDDVLARAVGWESAVVLAAPCCHHDLSAQLRAAPASPASAALTRHGILRERLADTLTDGLRAAILRREGYRVDVVEFVESKHTPRNTLLRAVRTGARSAAAADEVAGLTAAWQVHPVLEDRLARRSG